MHKSIKIAVFAFAVLLAGCVSTTNKTNAISLGMSKAEVIEIMGNPQSTRAAEGIEYMVYDLKLATNAGRCAATVFAFGAGCFRDKVKYFVAFQQGRVTSYGRVGDFDSTNDPEATINVNKIIKEVE